MGPTTLHCGHSRPHAPQPLVCGFIATIKAPRYYALHACARLDEDVQSLSSWMRSGAGGHRVSAGVQVVPPAMHHAVMVWRYSRAEVCVVLSLWACAPPLVQWDACGAGQQGDQPWFLAVGGVVASANRMPAFRRRRPDVHVFKESIYVEGAALSV